MIEQRIWDLISRSESRQEGFIALMEFYRESIYWHIRRLVVTHEDAEDVLQEAFIKIFRHIDGFKGESSLKTWIYRIATNEALRLYRRKRVATNSYDENGYLLELFEADQSINFTSMEARLQRAILALPTKQRVVFNLRYYEEMPYEEIAKITESSVATLKSNYHYATQRIKEQMLNQIEE